MKNKTLPMTVTKISLASIFLLSFSGCLKNNSDCEKWEVVDDKHTTGCVDWSCTGSRTRQLTFCGDDLKDAKGGNKITISTDNCCRTTRTFIRMIQ